MLVALALALSMKLSVADYPEPWFRPLWWWWRRGFVLNFGIAWGLGAHGTHRHIECPRGLIHGGDAASSLAIVGGRWSFVTTLVCDRFAAFDLIGISCGPVGTSSAIVEHPVEVCPRDCISPR
jgi:hypothetical protein